jgi:hypothetical protein
MTDLNTDDSYDQLTAKRKRQPRKMLPERLLRLLLAIAAVAIVIVVIIVVATTASNSSDTAGYQRYMTTIGGILERSDAVGAQVVKLLTEPGDTTRKEIQTRLDQAISASEKLKTEAAAVEVPEELLKHNVHEFFLLTMHFRSKGLTNLKPSLMNALELQDVDVPAEQISRSLTYLSNSDFLYQEVFLPRAADVLTVKKIDGVSVPSTRFLKDPDLASRSRVQEFLAVLKGIESLQAVHGVAITKVLVSPDDKQITAGKTHNLSSSDELAFLVTVENQGNMAEKEVPVVVTLVSPDKTEPQKVTVTIPELKSKEELTVTVKGLNPTTYAEVAALKVEAGPVKDEKYTDNNVIEAKVIFTL